MLFSGLQCHFPDFRAQLAQFNNVAILKVKDGKVSSVTEDELALTFGSAEAIIVAAGVEGSAEAAAAWVFEAVTAAGYSAIAANAAYAVAYIAVTAAVAFAAGKVMQALADKPDTSEKNEKNKHASSLYNGAQNVVEQGGAVALIYGRHRVGGTIISSEITTERLALLMPDAFSLYGGESKTFNVTSNDILREYVTVTSWSIASTTMQVGQTYTGAWYTVRVEANGDLVVTTNEHSSGEIALGYTATDSRDGTTHTTTTKVTVNMVYVWQNDGGS
ncbi:hypothetical protein WG922_07640 [Ramlibacter sp. AN1015]|uniref:hypothetical protein n=1 Tax=Ramlibacter sp. AN1015 TaxID=3133428 RepID=UPI0030BEAC95